MMSEPDDDNLGADEPDNDNLEAKLRAIAHEIGGSLERAIEQLDLGELTERIEELIAPLEQLDRDMIERLGLNEERGRELADLAAQWLSRQFGGSRPPQPSNEPQQGLMAATSGRRLGPHPLDTPTEEQGLALSALDSGRWKVDPGTEELVPIGDGPSPLQPVGLVGELRARDWIAPSGAVTLVGRDALARWLGSSS
jgi:hypothetical protein